MEIIAMLLGSVDDEKTALKYLTVLQVIPEQCTPLLDFCGWDSICHFSHVTRERTSEAATT